MVTKAQHTLDTRGLFCPEPVMMLHSLIADMQVGETVFVYATDPSTTRDFLKFCSFLGHQLLKQEEHSGEYHFLIQKGAAE